jgi:hypothetical protein
MAGTPFPRALRWLYFCVGIGALIACGIYVGTATRDPDVVPRLLRALMFLLIGLFATLMYGERKSSAPGDES